MSGGAGDARGPAPAAAPPDRSVRPALPADAAAIAVIQVRGIRAALEAGLDGVGTAPVLPVDAVADRWRATLSAPQPAGCRTLVALHGAAVAGFIACAPGEAVPPSPGRDDPIAPGTDILALEVVSEFGRSGHASRLLAALVDVARPVTLRAWVTSGDEAHTRFYQSAGFGPAGVRRRLDVAGRAVVEHLWWSQVQAEV